MFEVVSLAIQPYAVRPHLHFFHAILDTENHFGIFIMIANTSISTTVVIFASISTKITASTTIVVVNRNHYYLC